MAKKATITEIVVKLGQPIQFVETIDSHGHPVEPEPILLAKLTLHLPGDDEDVAVSLPIDDPEESLCTLIQRGQEKVLDQLRSKKQSLEGQVLNWS